ncbi:hypothetical protein ARNL5_02703 [Anaerolineae bacterium]|nr:hypothetical protein ARNL5_02703 [Anaerolineae bacterium]
MKSGKRTQRIKWQDFAGRDCMFARLTLILMNLPDGANPKRFLLTQPPARDTLLTGRSAMTRESSPFEASI